ncbi:MAG: hypothetical protein Q7T89_15990, partial [Anaerolineales bacterium]|nr:hypothetical protein [Anaerolineales bacterium]
GVNLLVWAILTGMIIVRLASYGDLNLSVANADTASYIKGGAAPIFSLTKSRLFTTNLLYHWADVQECEIQAISYPALRTETYRAVQPCFDGIVFFQNIVSIIAWGLLALVVSKRLVGGYEKLLAVFLITAFGFTPAIADWDSILSSESLTFSLFAVSMALVVEVGFRFAENTGSSKYSIPINVLAILALALWAFTRDANIYTLVVLLVTSLPVLAIPTLRKNKKLLVFIAGIFLITGIGLQSAMLSHRWEVPLANVFNDLILPHPARVEFMQKLGMPDPTSAEYSAWFVGNAPRSYARFLLFHPGYTLTAFTSELGGIFSENIQPYFYSEQTPARIALIAVNDILHPKTHLVFILDILLMAGLLFSIFRRKNKNFTVWLWLGTWLFLSASLTLAVGFFADSIGVTRHTMFAVEMFRLMMWIFLIILFDQANRKDVFEIN